LAINILYSQFMMHGEKNIKSCALGSTQPLKMSTRDFSWGKGGRCVRLTSYHPRSAERQENPGP